MNKIKIHIQHSQASIVTMLIHGRDQRAQPTVFDAVHVTFGCTSGWLAQCRVTCTWQMDDRSSNA